MAQAQSDKRPQRTQQALRDALLELVVEPGYEKSSVQDILDRAGVGRATFYEYFRNKEDLLRRSLDQLREHLMQEWNSASRGGAQSRVALGFSLAFFRHVDGHRRLYRAIMGRESGVIVDRQMRRMLADLVKAEIVASGREDQDGVRTDLAAQYVVGALMSTVTWWLDRNVKLSPDEIDGAFRRMTLPALQAFCSA